jgi:hypothetical protein
MLDRGGCRHPLRHQLGGGVSEIADFIEVQYRRIEAAAREAGARSATWDVNGTWHLEGVEHNVIGGEEAFCHPHNADHIAIHDPAYVLADIESKRRIVARHSDPRGKDPSCSSIDYPENAKDCETLRLLAAPFSGEPGYKEDWAVE